MTMWATRYGHRLSNAFCVLFTKTRKRDAANKPSLKAVCSWRVDPCQKGPRRVAELRLISKRTESVTKTTHYSFPLDFY